MIIGATHVYKGRPSLPDTPRDTLRDNVAEALGRTHPGVAYSVESIAGVISPIAQAIPGNTRPHTLIETAGSELGKLNGSALFGENITLFRIVGGERVPVKVTREMLPPIERLIDAVLYLGRYSNAVPIDVAEYMRNPALLAELRRRIGVLKEVYGVDIWTDDLERALAAAR